MSWVHEWSCLVFNSGLAIIPDDKDKTAFITRRGCFRWKVMPFGLTCAPSVFQHLMDLVLCGLTYETCRVYLDDIIVFSRDFYSHIERLQQIFDHLKVANLKLHMKKCSLFQRRVSFLGHVLTEKEIEVQPDKVAAVQNWPTPRKLTELRSFVLLRSPYTTILLTSNQSMTIAILLLRCYTMTYIDCLFNSFYSIFLFFHTV